jgi:hypothetical protein
MRTGGGGFSRARLNLSVPVYHFFFYGLLIYIKTYYIIIRSSFCFF